MQNRYLVIIGSVLLGLFILIAAGVLIVPNLVARQATRFLQDYTGLDVTQDQARLTLNPLGVEINHVKLSTSSGAAVAEADKIIVPLTALVFGMQNTAISFDGCTLHFLQSDGREVVRLEKLVGTLTQTPEGGLDVVAGGDLGGSHINTKLSIASLKRSRTEGGPADFNLDSASGSFNYTGRLKLKDGLDLAGTFGLDTADTKEFMTWLSGAEFGGIEAHWPFHFTSSVETRDGALAFSNVEAQLGSMKALGNATYSIANGKPKLGLDLGMDMVDLSLFGLTAPVPSGPWREKPFSLTGLGAMDATWHISTNAMKLGSFVTGAGQLDGSLTEKVLEASFSSKEEAATLASLTVDDHEAAPKFALNLDAKNIGGEKFLNAVTGYSFISGPVSVVAKLNSSGFSPAALASQLAGSLSFDVSQGELTGIDAAKFFQAAATAPVQGWGGGKTSGVDGHGLITFSDGIGTVDEASFITPEVSGTVKGEIDILRQALNLKIAPKALPKISVVGPWTGPQFFPDKSP